MAVVSMLSPARLLSWIRRLLGVGATVGGVPLLDSAPGLPSAADVTVGTSPTSRPASVSALRQAVMENADLLSAIQTVAEDIAEKPVRVSVKDGSGVRDIEGHPLETFLGKRVVGYSQHAYIQRAMYEALTSGEWYAEIRGRPSNLLPQMGGLLPHDSGQVDPQVSLDGLLLTHHLVQTTTGQYPVQPDSMVFWAINPVMGGTNRFRGVSPVYPLLRRLKAVREDEEYEQSAPRNAPRNLLLEIDPSVESMNNTEAVKAAVSSMAAVYQRTGYHLAVKGLKVSDLKVDSHSDRMAERSESLSSAITLALHLAPVLRNQSVTNDSAAKEQHRQYRRALRWLAADFWAAHEPLVHRLATPAEIASGIHLRSDWSADLDAEARDDRAARLALIKQHIENGVPPRAAYHAEGVPYPELPEEVPDEDGRDQDRNAPPRLRAVPGGAGG